MRKTRLLLNFTEMSYRYMRIIVMFDLPTQTVKDMRTYRNFRKFLIKNGFFMMQESIYCKLAQNTTAADSIIENIRRNRPLSGIVQVLKITEKQFEKIEYITGGKTSNVLDTDERLVVL